MTKPDSFLTLDAASARLGISRATLYRMKADGKIEFVKLGARTMVRESEVARIVGIAATNGSEGTISPDAARYDEPMSLEEFVKLQDEDAERTLRDRQSDYDQDAVVAASGLTPAPSQRN